MKRRLIEGDGAWPSVQILEQTVFPSFPLASWWLLTGYRWRQAWAVISEPLSRGAPDARVCPTAAFRRLSFHFFFAGVCSEVYCAWMRRMLLSRGGWVWDLYQGSWVTVIRYPCRGCTACGWRRSHRLKTSKSWANNKQTVILELCSLVDMTSWLHPLLNLSAGNQSLNNNSIPYTSRMPGGCRNC